MSRFAHEVAGTFEGNLVAAARQGRKMAPNGSAVVFSLETIPRFNYTDGCAFSETEVVLIESQGSARCFDLDTGGLLWTHDPPPRTRLGEFCFRRDLGCFVGLRYAFEGATPERTQLIQFNRRTGEATNNLPVDLGRISFCLGGKAVFTADFRLISADTGQLMRDFFERLPEPVREHFGKRPESPLKLTQEQRAAIGGELVHMLKEGADEKDATNLAFQKALDYWRKKLEEDGP